VEKKGKWVPKNLKGGSDDNSKLTTPTNPHTTPPPKNKTPPTPKTKKRLVNRWEQIEKKKNKPIGREPK